MGRGVLVDYAAYCERHQIPLDPFASVGVPLGVLQEIIEEEGLVIRKGDILIVRFGFTAAYEKLSEEECVALAARPEPDFVGVESSSEMLRWIWESGIAAVAGALLRAGACRRRAHTDRGRVERRAVGGGDAARWTSTPVVAQRLGTAYWGNV